MIDHRTVTAAAAAAAAAEDSNWRRRGMDLAAVAT